MDRISLRVFHSSRRIWFCYIYTQNQDFFYENVTLRIISSADNAKAETNCFFCSSFPISFLLKLNCT